MLFFTSLLIFSFCFVFYVVWNQFLRKDTRLSIGLKILQKKMDVLENFSEKSDIQLRKGVELLDKKNRELERIVNEARFCIFKMEKLITGIENKSKNLPKPSNKTKISLVRSAPEQNKTAFSSKKQKPIVIQEPPQKFSFGESPFSHLNFVDTRRKEPQPKQPEKDSFQPSPSV